MQLTVELKFFLKGIKTFSLKLQMKTVPSIGKQSHLARPLTLKVGIKCKGKFYDSRPHTGRKTVTHCSFTSVAAYPLVIATKITVMKSLLAEFSKLRELRHSAHIQYNCTRSETETSYIS